MANKKRSMYEYRMFGGQRYAYDGAFDMKVGAELRVKANRNMGLASRITERVHPLYPDKKEWAVWAKPTRRYWRKARGR